MKNELKLRNVKGTFDYLPNEMIIRNEIINKLKLIFERYGYLPLETPILTHFDLLASKYAGGAEILKEVYTLEDQGKRKLGLRYDLTVPFSKVIAMYKDLNLPLKRYEIGKVFRDGPVKVGRNREFYQCDVDVCGIDNRYIEIEFFTLVIEAFKSLGIDIVIEWNNRKLLSGLIKEVEIEEEFTSRVILSVDKLAKIGQDGVILELEDLGINKSKLYDLFKLFELDLSELKEKYNNSDNELLLEGLNEVIEINDYIEKLSLTDYTKFTPFLARGLEIYTGIIFEFFDKQKRITSSLGGGGRYNNIITNFIDDGNSYPAIGLSFGLEPIYELIKKEYENKPLYELFIIPINTQAESLVLANKLREKGLKVIVEMNNKKVKNSLNWANTNKVRHVIILGEDEINNKVLKIKDMDKSTDYEVDLDDITKIISIVKSKEQ
jgi:histidyl-tRNA synthetase